MAEQTIDRIGIEISAQANSAYKSIDKLVDAIRKLRDVTDVNTNNLQRIANSISALNSSLSNASTASKNANSIAKSLSKLRELQNLNLDTATGKIRQFISVSQQLNGLGNSLQGVKDFSSGITRLQNSLKKIDKLPLDDTKAKVDRLVAALKPLTDEMMRAGPYAVAYAESLKATASSLRTLNNAGTLTSKATASLDKLNNSLGKGFNLTKLGAVTAVVREISLKIGAAVNSMNEYIEDMNLFTVSLKDGAAEAEKFANKMQNLLGINAGDAMRNMGLFYNLVESFGATSEQSYILSKNLTQLGYDLSSFFNISTEDAFQKLQSGIAGEQTCLTQSKGCVVICLNRGTSKRLAA